jgi:hypothetical protein
LAEWDQATGTHRQASDAASVRVLTPGSRAVRRWHCCGSLRPPDDENDEDAATRITSTAASLLALAGYADMGPHDRELTLCRPSWPRRLQRRRQDLAVARASRFSDPRSTVSACSTWKPTTPAKERQELALRFNSVLAVARIRRVARRAFR